MQNLRNKKILDVLSEPTLHKIKTLHQSSDQLLETHSKLSKNESLNNFITKAPFIKQK